MKTSQEWWNEVKVDSTKTESWLRKQYRGEVTAASRIQKLAKQYTETGSWQTTVLNIIANQETQHAGFVKELLDIRGIEVDISDLIEAENRYWAETLPGIKDFVTGTAVAAHAEKMRLERIETIVNDEESPTDIRAAFTKILQDELWHESAFRKMSTPLAMSETAGDHELGRAALGLVP